MKILDVILNFYSKNHKIAVSIDIGAIKKKFGYTNQSSLDDYFDKDGAEKELLTDFGSLEKSGPVVQKVTQIVEYEPPAIPNHFASGSTPRNAGSRYLKWNGFGMIRSVQDDDANNIEVCVTFFNTKKV